MNKRLSRIFSLLTFCCLPTLFLAASVYADGCPAGVDCAVWYQQQINQQAQTAQKQALSTVKSSAAIHHSDTSMAEVAAKTAPQPVRQVPVPLPKKIKLAHPPVQQNNSDDTRRAPAVTDDGYIRQSY